MSYLQPKFVRQKQQVYECTWTEPGARTGTRQATYVQTLHGGTVA